MGKESEQCWLVLDAYCDRHCVFLSLFTVFCAELMWKKFYNSLESECCQCDTKPICHEFLPLNFGCICTCIFSKCVTAHPGWFDKHHCCVRMLFILFCLACKHSLLRSFTYHQTSRHKHM